MIALRDYAKIKNNYCICYFGYCDEYLVQLRLLKPYFEQAFAGLNVCLGCRDDKIEILGNSKHVLKVSDLKARKNEFAHIKEIRYNGHDHPIEELLQEAGIQNPVISTESNRATHKAVIFTKSNYPTRDLKEIEIKRLKKIAFGLDIEFDTNIDNAGMVLGVECSQLYEAAAKGIQTTLMPTGIGTCLYKTFFPKGEIVA